MQEFIRYLFIFNWDYGLLVKVGLFILLLLCIVAVSLGMDLCKYSKGNLSKAERELSFKILLPFTITFTILLTVIASLCVIGDTDFDYRTEIKSEFFGTYQEEVSQLNTWQEKLSLYDTYLEGKLLSLKQDAIEEIAILETRVNDFERLKAESLDTANYYLYNNSDVAKSLAKDEFTICMLQDEINRIDKRLSEIN